MNDERGTGKPLVFTSAFIVPTSSFSFTGTTLAIILLDFMKRREAVLISNPNAGRGGKHRESEIARFCESLKRRGVEVEVLNTSGPNDAARLANGAAAGPSLGRCRVIRRRAASAVLELTCPSRWAR